MSAEPDATGAQLWLHRSVRRDRGWDSAAALARSSDEQQVRMLREAGVASTAAVSRGRSSGDQAEKLAGILQDLAGAVVDRYRGNLRRLRGEARQDPERER